MKKIHLNTFPKITLVEIILFLHFIWRPMMNVHWVRWAELERSH